MAEREATRFIRETSAHHSRGLELRTSSPLPDLEQASRSLGQMASGQDPIDESTSVYSRLHNGTVAEFEAAMAAVEKTEGAVAFASGMSAISALLLTARTQGSHIVAIRPIYGCTDHLLSSGLTGLRVTWTTPEGVSEAIEDDTALIMAETPANPTLQLLDIKALVAAAGSIPVAVDSTFASPYLQNPTELGATLTIHSATKYIGGHGDVMGGVIATNQKWTELLRQTRIVTGGVLHPLAAYLLRRGLSTLPVRMERAQSTAQILARRLVETNGVEKVHYPGFGKTDPTGLVGTQMRGPGAMITFEVSSFEMAQRLMKKVSLITPAVSLGSTDTLIQHPASLTHQIVSDEGKESGGITPGLLRLSVGLEDPEDLWEDLVTSLTEV